MTAKGQNSTLLFFEEGPLSSKGQVETELGSVNMYTDSIAVERTNQPALTWTFDNTLILADAESALYPS